MKTFNTLAEFKLILAVGDKLNCIMHNRLIGTNSEDAVIKDYECPVRVVSIKQTNSFALKTENGDSKTGETDGTLRDSYCEYPQASMCKIENNKLIIMRRDARGFKGYQHKSNPDYQKLPLIPWLTYWFAE